MSVAIQMAEAYVTEIMAERKARRAGLTQADEAHAITAVAHAGRARAKAHDCHSIHCRYYDLAGGPCRVEVERVMARAAL